jgi:hypothetical protein
MKMNYIKLISTLNTGMAYLDPGTGSIIIQLLISTLAGVGIYFLSRIKAIKNIFRKKSAEIAEDDIEDDLFDE